jgi:hypothetical protein
MATAHDASEFAQFKGTQPAWGSSGEGFGRFSVMKFHVDMEAVSDELAATVSGAASDTIAIWDIPAGCHILSVLMNVTTVEGAAATVAIGDSDNSAGWMAATSINALSVNATTGVAGFGGTAISTDTYGIIGGRMYAAVNSLKLLFATAADIDTAVFDIYVICCFLDCASDT